MQSSNLAARMEVAVSDLPNHARPALQVITNQGPLLLRRSLPRASFDTRRIVIRDQGYRTFRVF
ncbi:MAG TPA: hypothetical protein VK624_06760 [Steroidobacteraceae bacterium]|jgi:hypothetical protein|nr:hypothetical protein [Steroidobacteraceae bacterium]